MWVVFWYFDSVDFGLFFFIIGKHQLLDKHSLAPPSGDGHWENWPGTLHWQTMQGVLVECVTWKWTVLNQHRNYVSRWRPSLFVHMPNTHTRAFKSTHGATHLTQIQTHFTLNTLWRRSIISPWLSGRGKSQLRDEETTQSHTASNHHTGIWTQICQTLLMPFHQVTLFPSTMLPLPHILGTHFLNLPLKTC